MNYIREYKKSFVEKVENQTNNIDILIDIIYSIKVILDNSFKYRLEHVSTNNPFA